LEREFFVLYGGVRLLFQLFASPYGEPNSRRTALYSGKHEVWNEVLVILREVAIAIPTISEKIFENSDIVFLFSLLHHQAMFDNTMNLLEEILASRDETFCLLLVPNFFSLVDSFSSRQLAHFCRVLSLVLFEPEDRQIMEGSQVLKSIDLLQLRRNRMAKNSSGIVERNQSLVIMCVIIFLAYCLLTLECTGN
jgi:Trpc4-associated protein